MSECVITLRRCQRVGEKREYGFNWTLFLASRWQADHPFPTDQCIRPATLRKQTGLEYKASGGQSNGFQEPRWPAAIGASVSDGSVIWTAQELSFSSIKDRLSAASTTWVAPSALTLSDDATTDTAGLQQTRATLTGGVAGQTYDVVNEIVTVGGKEYHAILRLKIE